MQWVRVWQESWRREAKQIKRGLKRKSKLKFTSSTTTVFFFLPFFFLFLLFHSPLWSHRFAIWCTVLASHCHTRYALFIAVPVGLWKQAPWPRSVCCQEWMVQSRNVSQTGGEGVSLDLWTFAVLYLQACHIKGRTTPSTLMAVCVYAAQIMRLPVRSSAVKSIMKNTQKRMPGLKSLVY